MTRMHLAEPVTGHNPFACGSRPVGEQPKQSTTDERFVAGEDRTVGAGDESVFRQSAISRGRPSLRRSRPRPDAACCLNQHFPLHRCRDGMSIRLLTTPSRGLGTGLIRPREPCFFWTASFWQASPLPGHQLTWREFHAGHSANGSPPCPRADHRRSKADRRVRELPLQGLT